MRGIWKGLAEQYNTISVVVSVVLFAGIGTAFLLASHAATPTVSFETENGTITSVASVLTDATASGGQAVKFGANGSAIPALCANGGTYLWSNLETCGWPGPTNTGAVASQCPGGVLTVNSGSASRTITVSTAGATISCQNITGCLNITAANVMVTNVKIACNSGKTGTAANGTAAIFVDDGASATVNHVEINAMNGVHSCIWHQGTSLSVTAVNCYGADDGIFSWADTSYSSTTGDHFTIADSYFHDFTIKTSNGHVDGYQTEGAGNGLIDHNTYLMTSDSGNNDTDSAVAIWDSLKSSHDITVQDNLIAGGGFSMYAEDYDPSEASPAGGASVTNIVYTGNKFSNHLFGCVGLYGVWYPRGNPTDAWHRSGNMVLETGQNVDSANPTYQGASCT